MVAVAVVGRVAKGPPLGRMGLLRDPKLAESSSSSSKRERVVDEDGDVLTALNAGVVRRGEYIETGRGLPDRDAAPGVVISDFGDGPFPDGVGERSTDDRDPRMELDMSVTSESRSDARFACFSSPLPL